ncbi:MAG: leucine-rich repeat protein [Erysipelotrichales bacterium]|nr:leucine-rich repeat protein [Erysipelotrichales bacterium]
MKKKISSAILLFIVFGLISIVSTIYGYSSSLDEMEIAKNENFSAIYLENISRSMDLIDHTLSKFQTNSPLTRGGLQESYNEEFAGIWIDEEGNLNVGISNNYIMPFTAPVRQLSNDIIINSFNYSYNHLNNIKELLVSKMDYYGIFTLAISEETNQVLVYLNSYSFLEQIIRTLQANNLYSESAIDFIVDQDGVINPKSRPVYAGDHIGGTVGANVMCNMTGRVGVLTNYHVTRVGHGLVHSNLVLGIAERGQVGGSIDASFTPFTDQDGWSHTPHVRHGHQTFTNVRIGRDSQIITGAPIMRVGRVTGITFDRINNSNVTMQLAFNGTTTIRNTFRYSEPGMNGDSGGPVYIVGADSLYLIGLHFASIDNLMMRFGYACRMSHIMNDLNVTPITNDMYNTTPLAGNNLRIDSLNINPRANMTIPSTLNGRTVTEVGSNAFANRRFSSLNIPNTITTIGSSAFANNPYLRDNIEIPVNVLNIGAFAFSNIGNAIFDVRGRSATPAGWHQHWNPHNRQVRFNGLNCIHNFIIIGNVRVCQICDIVSPINVITPTIVSGRQIRNNNSWIVDVWIRYQASGDNDWQSTIIHRSLPSNNTLNIPQEYFHRGDVEVWFEINGMMSSRISMSNSINPPPVIPNAPVFTGNRTILNNNTFAVNVWISYEGSGDGDSFTYILRSKLLQGQTFMIPNPSDYWSGFTIWFEVNGRVSPSLWFS